MKDIHDNSKKSSELQYKIPGLLHYHFKTIDSTNTWAKKNPDKWSPQSLTLVSAEEQVEGRGRFKRKWVSPSGVNLYTSFCLLVDWQRNDAGQIPQLLAYTVVKTLEELHITAKIKWPNDIFIGNKKVGGILCEVMQHEHKKGVICGLGLNINMPKNMLEDIDQPATSLLAESGSLYKISGILQILTVQFNNYLKTFYSCGFNAFFNEFEMMGYFSHGQEIRIQDGGQLWVGKFLKLNADGSLVLELPEKQVKVIVAGEILGY